MGAIAPIVAIVIKVAGAVSAAYGVVKTIDTVAGTHMVTPKPPEQQDIDDKYALGGPSFATSDSVTAASQAEQMQIGFNNYINTLARVAPSYAARASGTRRKSYEAAVNRKSDSQ